MIPQSRQPRSPAQKRVITPSAPAFPPTLAAPAPGSALLSQLRHAAASLSDGLARRTLVSAATAVTTGCVLAQVASDTGTLKSQPLGVLDPAGSLLAPAAVSWWLWPPVAALWLGYALYQWLPRQRRNPRHSQVGWIILAAEVTALAWLMSVSAASAAGVLAVAAAQLAVGLAAVSVINRQPAESSAEAWLTDVALGWFLALGVLTLTTALAFVLTREEADLGGWGATAWTLIGLMTVTVGVTLVCMTDRGHLPVGLAAGAGLVSVAVERLMGTPGSAVIAASAAGAAFLVIVSAGSRRHQVDRERRLQARRGGQRALLSEDAASS